MPGRPKVIALDVDPASLESFHQAFPGWQVEAANGSTHESLAATGTPARRACWSSAPART